ncbi:MAG: energy-coupling factor transporter ATPase [Lachnospiraceae bacterium]|nr:energy-coupling factor transporter ATPase [Lachnospiraceae bacterium]
MSIIRTQDLVYEYVIRDETGAVEEKNRALRSVNLSVKAGDFVAVVGRNGSGKSTLAKHFNALLVPTEGTVWIEAMDTRDETHLWDIRAAAGMVFQNPDNQIVATIVEEDVGFGPENIGVPTEEIWERVGRCLSEVGMSAYAQASPGRLSGGQKQRVAIAGVLAMKPKCIVLDESTAMLDPQGRREVLKTIRELNQAEHITVLLITHYMEETVFADRVIVMKRGEIMMDDVPHAVFARAEELEALGLTLPKTARLAQALRRRGLDLPEGLLTGEELAEAVIALYRGKETKA